MKQNFYFLLMSLFALSFISNKAKAAPKVTLTTTTIAAADINQGTTYNVVYAVDMKVTVSAVTITRMDFTLSGTHDNSDLTYAYLYYNATSPDISGATYLGYTVATYAAPHAYSVNVSKAMAVGDQGYFIVAVNVSNTATDNHTVLINGATDPMVFGFTTAPNITNSQTNKAKAQKIQAADITLTSATVTAADINQGTTYDVVYAAKMKVLTEPTTVNNIQFTLSGTHDNSDLTYAYLYYNASSPVISGATYLGYTVATYAAPHAYSVNVSKAMAVGDQGYFIVAVNVSNTATDNHTVLINGATDPMVFGFTTAPNITNSQTNKAKAQKIQAADITLTTPTLSSGSIVQGSTYNVVYAAKMNVLTEPTTVNNIQFTLSGNHDNNDLTYAYLYYNASSPVISGATYLGYAVATYDAPHTYSVNVSKAMAAGDQGYFIVAVNVSATASVGKTVRVNGAIDPMVFGFTTAPNITDNQKNSTGTQTISASFAKGNTENAENISAINNDNNKVNKVFPNPANSIFNFTVTGKQQQYVKAQLTNRSGNVVLVKSILVNKGNNVFTVNVSSLINGIYYLVLITDKGELIDKQQVNIQH
ncbi:MAG: T9SS type A sorting domain-containing protein [Parafilimonas sp.]